MGGDCHLAYVPGLAPQFFPIFMSILWAVVRHSKVQVLCGFRVTFRVKLSLGIPNKTSIVLYALMKFFPPIMGFI
jgi:hypothetical protein